ncbi:amidohydrolase [Pseudonocardia sp. ICBG1293]|uniref:amidohydrolase n=1 Tax=Pseudonocardia sp. ICBG1293 TaxID=2844382 RepID=UPI001CCC9FEC|nr:amidohydrolase [Pseudonocardia sp. ICBG1293]
MATAVLNGRLYTVAGDEIWAEAALIENGVFTVVGTTAEVRDAAPADTECIDLQGRMAMPGLHDAHVHLLVSGLKFQHECRITPGVAAEQMVEELAGCGCTGPAVDGEREWLIGGEIFPHAFGEGELDRQVLDEAFPDRPVFLYDHTAHNGMANSRALELAGLDDDVEDPPGGRFIRRPGSRELTGELIEQARWPVMRAIPDYPREVYLEAMRWAVATCHEFGITSVQEAGASAQALRALRELEDAGELHLHVAAHLPWREEGFGMASTADLDRSIAHRAELASAHVDTRFIKIWLDGAPLPPHMTHADLLADGSVDQTNILVPPDQLLEKLRGFDAEGLSVKIHCTGRGSVRAALDAIEGARRDNGPDGPIHEIAHCTFIHDDDYQRLGHLNVVAEMSPALWHTEAFNLPGSYKFGTVLRSGATMTVGSDWINTPNPNLFPALQGMLQWGENSVELPTAIELMTSGGARVVGRSDRRGSVEVGKSADLIVLDRNILEVPTDEVGGTQVLRTLVEGRTVFEREPDLLR